MSVIKYLALGMAFSPLTSSPLSAMSYPGTAPGPAQTRSTASSHILENHILRATWTQNNKSLGSPEILNRVSGESFQGGDSLFAIATRPQTLDPERVYLGIRRQQQQLQAIISQDGKNWETLASLPLSDFKGKLKAFRIGKTSSKGNSSDYPSAGEIGRCEIQQVQVVTTQHKIHDLTASPQHIHRSKRATSQLNIANELITIDAHANSAVYAEYKAPDPWQQISCRIKKGSDKGLSWGPGITLVFDDGSFAIANIRKQGQFTILSPAGEQLVNKTATASLNCDLHSNNFTLSSPVKALPVKHGKALEATFRHRPSGIHVRWRAELRDDSNYIRQHFTLASQKDLTLHGLQFIQGSTSGARQIGTVPGSPVASESLFFGIEMPFTAHYFSTDGFRSGFPCQLPLGPDTRYAFQSVAGVYPANQLRRAFLYYLERERSTPYHQFLHYNCWYDFAPSREAFTQAIHDYHRELTQKRGVTLDSFVMDDGWDDYHAGLWTFHPTRFPNGFNEVASEARKANSQLGVWISPLGGYSGANQRTAHAKKMGLIDTTLDLSQPKYYQWFYQKCLGMMKDHGVNYFKWDKAGSGVSPHFMALIQCGQALKQHDPKLFINVTVGTWPSPFWLNHIDCTWRTGTGDVAWMGVGDEREQWLTFRDWGCYEKFVKPAPLYPLNSVMHHGLVAGRHYQGVKVAKAGVNMKHAARSYFATGANLLELYLTADLMTDSAWDQVAEAAKWAKQNESILVDSHWVGGNPKKLEVYGWASWSPQKSILTLRNPSDKSQHLTLDISQTLEVPKGHSIRFRTQNAYPDQNFKTQTLEGQHRFVLEPFEVLCLELIPLPPTLVPNPQNPVKP